MMLVHTTLPSGTPFENSPIEMHTGRDSSKNSSRPVRGLLFEWKRWASSSRIAAVTLKLVLLEWEPSRLKTPQPVNEWKLGLCLWCGKVNETNFMFSCEGWKENGAKCCVRALVCWHVSWVRGHARQRQAGKWSTCLRRFFEILHFSWIFMALSLWEIL